MGVFFAKYGRVYSVFEFICHIVIACCRYVIRIMMVL